MTGRLSTNHVTEQIASGCCLCDGSTDWEDPACQLLGEILGGAQATSRD